MSAILEEATDRPDPADGDRRALAATADRVVRLARAKKATEKPARGRGRSKKARERCLRLTARDTEVEEVGARVDDPWPDPKRDPLLPPQQVHVSLNRRVDILQEELSHRRITESQYQVGRIVQAVFEKAQGRVGGGGWNAGDRVDAALAHELAVIHALDTAEQVQALVRKIERAVGTVGSRFLRQIVVERSTFAQYATARGKRGERGVSQVAAHFRMLLEDVAEAWAARGVRPAGPGWGENQRGTNLMEETVVRGARLEPLPDEDYDADGMMVPAGRGYRVGQET